MKTLNSNDLHVISGGSPSFSNSFLAGIKGDENFHLIISTEALFFMCVGTLAGLPVGPVGAVVGASLGNLFGSLVALDEYTLGANYREAQLLLTQSK